LPPIFTPAAPVQPRPGRYREGWRRYEMLKLDCQSAIRTCFVFSADGKDRTNREAFGTLAPEGSLSDGGQKT